jgi:glycosyltransferase involved in cell wall biosynthesis
MKIAMVWHCPYPWDIRIEKMAHSFTAAGNEVVLLAKGRRGEPSRVQVGGMLVERIRARFPGGVIARLLSLPFFFNPYWFYRVWRIAKKEEIDLLIVRDLPLALLAGLVGKLLRRPVVFDMAENYPAALLCYQRKIYRPFLFNNAWLPRAYEKLSLRLIDRVIVVADEQKERLMRAGIAHERIVVVGNTPDYLSLQKLSAVQQTDERVAGRYILYSGFIDRHRGIGTLILAFNEIRERYRDLKLVLIGDGRDVPELKALVRRLRLEERVLFTGWLDFTRIPAFIKHSALCVVPHLKSEHTDTTLPNKIFDYLYFNKPVVAADAGPLKRILKEAESGIVFKSGDHADLSRAIVSILDGRPRKKMNGRTLIENKYNWENDSRVLLKAIGVLVSYE